MLLYRHTAVLIVCAFRVTFPRRICLCSVYLRSMNCHVSRVLGCAPADLLLLAAASAAASFHLRWVFLYYNHEEANLDVVVLENDDTPAMNPSTTPILLLDLWEHAYYLDVSETRHTGRASFKFETKQCGKRGQKNRVHFRLHLATALDTRVVSTFSTLVALHAHPPRLRHVSRLRFPARSINRTACADRYACVPSVPSV